MVLRSVPTDGTLFTKFNFLKRQFSTSYCDERSLDPRARRKRISPSYRVNHGNGHASVNIRVANLRWKKWKF